MPDVRGVVVPDDKERLDDLRPKAGTPGWNVEEIMVADLGWLCELADEGLDARSEAKQAWSLSRMREIAETVNVKLPPGERMTVTQVREVLRWLGDTVEEAR